MHLKALLERWFRPPAGKDEMIQRFWNIAAREAIIGLALLVIYFTVPAWADEADASRLSGLFLAGAGILATLAAATAWRAALIKRDLY